MISNDTSIYLSALRAEIEGNLFPKYILAFC